VKPGASLRELHSLSVQLISEGIVQLGLFKHASPSEVHASLYRRLYWHSVGHWLGMDTHDTALMGHDRYVG
jgi:Xaa-Pro aminopeptidase